MDYETDIRTKEEVPLIVAFAGLRGSLSEPVYEFKNFLSAHFSCYFIFIKDRHQCWYHKGVHGLGNDIGSTVEALRSKIKRIPHSQLITIGTSAGGYGAILFGCLLDADRIYAFSPQTFLDRGNRQRYKDQRYQGELNKMYKAKTRSPDYFDLKNLEPSGSIHLVYGKDDPVDNFHVERLRDWPNAEIKVVLGGHVVVKNMRESGELLEFLKGIK